MKVSFSVSSQSILKQICNDYYLVIWHQPLKFREISLSIQKLDHLILTCRLGLQSVSPDPGSSLFSIYSIAV